MKQFNYGRFSIIALLLGLLGFSSSCDNGRMEYGSPYADYKAKVSVTDADDVHIQGLQVTPLNKGNYPVGDSINTDINGITNISWIDWPKLDYMKLSIKDKDGPANGVYKDTIVNEKVDFKKVANGSGAWYEGAYEGELTVKLKAQ